MGKHVDTTRPEDQPYMEGHRFDSPYHRKEGWPAVTYIPDVWSGDPETDRAWARAQENTGWWRNCDLPH